VTKVGVARAGGEDEVIVGMVIAPAFEPLLRVPFGLIAGPKEVASRGLLSMFVGYALLALGAALAALVIGLVDPSPPVELEADSWVRYWSTFTPEGVVVSAFAGMAGAVVVTGQRSVLTAGVMIALALIPSMSIVGMALVSGDFALAGRGRWLLDVVLVMLAGALVLGLKQRFLHRHRALIQKRAGPESACEGWPHSCSPWPLHRLMPGPN
jgi:uncharacterized membrane protein